MQKYCPLCIKNGIRSQMKAFQLNMEEAVLSCEKIDVSINFLSGPSFVYFIFVLTILLVFQCIWPFGYLDPIFIQRSALTCNWDEEPDLTTAYVPISTELALYTPPTTPRGEALECSVNSMVDDKLSELSSNNESTNSKSEIANSNKRPMPKIINDEKVNIHISKMHQTRHLRNRKIKKRSHATFAKDSSENYNALLATSECSQFSLHTQCETQKGQSKNNNVQTNEVANCLDTNILITTTNAEVKVDITNNSNDSTLNITNTIDPTIDSLIDDILNYSGEIDNKIDDNWLDLILI